MWATRILPRFSLCLIRAMLDGAYFLTKKKGALILVTGEVMFSVHSSAIAPLYDEWWNTKLGKRNLQKNALTLTQRKSINIFHRDQTTILSSQQNEP